MFMQTIHPWIVLKDEQGSAPAELARQINVPLNRASRIIAGRRASPAAR